MKQINVRWNEFKNKILEHRLLYSYFKRMLSIRYTVNYLLYIYYRSIPSSRWALISIDMVDKNVFSYIE